MEERSIEELVRWAYEGAWNNGDLEALLTIVSDDVELRTSGRIVDLQNEYRGHEGVRRYWRDVRAPWESLSIDVERVLENGEVILILFRFRAKGREGMEVDAKFGQVATMRDGFVTSVIAYADWASAAEAAGIGADAV